MIRGKEVTLRHITKRLGEVVALRDLSLSIEAGSFVALLGASAAAKTTMLRVLAGFEMPNGGTVLIGDRDVTHVPPHRRNIGLVFQGFALFPHMTVLENVTYPLRVRRAPRDQQLEKARAVLELVELTGLENRRPHQLSGGQQPRVGLARALVNEPSVLLLDEPLGSLDRKLRDQMQEELRRLHRRVGSTFVLVTHDQEEALALADTVGILRDGALEQLGSPEEISTRPASPFAASFIGEMNLLPTQILDVSLPRIPCRCTTIPPACPAHAGAPPGALRAEVDAGRPVTMMMLRCGCSTAHPPGGRSKASCMTRQLRPRMATRSLQSVATSINWSAWVYLPVVVSPQW